MTAEADWFVIVNDEIRGPYTADQMRSAAQKGLVVASTSVRKGSSGDWFRAELIKGLLPSAPPSTPPSLEESASPPSAAASAPSAPIPGIKAEGPAEPPKPPKPPPANAGEQPLIKTDEAAASRSSSPKRRRSRRRSNAIPVIVVAACGIALLLGMLFWLSRPAATPEKTEAKPDRVEF